MDRVWAVLKGGEKGFLVGDVYATLEIAKDSLRMRHPEIEFFLANATIELWGMRLPEGKEMTLQLLPIRVLHKPEKW